MFGHTGRVFEIYSIGDGLYMQRILNGVAGLSNSGILLQLLSLGLVIGILIMGVRNVIHGGNKLELGTVLTSFLLGIFLFGMRADVAVIDVSYVPGQKTQGDFTVSNLPFGVAAMGSLISNAGFILTSRMEQAFSIPGMENMGMASGGFGKTLEWVTSLRLWGTPISPPDPAGRNAFIIWNTNLTNYLNECTLPALEMGHLNISSIRSVANPLTFGNDVDGGIGYNSQYLMVGILQTVGAEPVPYTCQEGFEQLVLSANPGYEAFVSYLGSRMFDSGGTSGATATLQNAFTAIGYEAAEVQGVILAESIGQSLTESLGNAKSSLALSKMNELMIEQASRQRLIQWAAEETMFRRIMRPMMAFFESLMYALSPFMALAVGLGTFGIQTVFRYMMLTIWVVLWMPVLSVIQLFQVTSVQHTVAAMKNAMDGSTSMGVTSIAAAEHLRSEAMEWMASGAALAAWTPAITMALVWSGSVTASALAGKLQGQDHINEKLSSPDTVNASPSIQRGSSYDHSQAGSLAMGGSRASLPAISIGATQARNEASSAREMDSSEERLTAATGKVLKESWSQGRGGSAAADLVQRGAASLTHNGTTVDLSGVNWDSTEGTQIKDALNSGNMAQVQSVLRASGRLAIGSGDAVPAVQGGVGGEASKVGTTTDSTATSKERANSKGFNFVLGNGFTLSLGTTNSQELALSSSLSNAATSSGSHLRDVANDTSVQNALGRVQQTQAAYEASTSRGRTLNTGQTLSADVIGGWVRSDNQNVVNQAAALVENARQLGGSQAIEKGAVDFNQKHGMPMPEARAAAAGMFLSGQYDASGWVSDTSDGAVAARTAAFLNTINGNSNAYAAYSAGTPGGATQNQGVGANKDSVSAGISAAETKIATEGGQVRAGAEQAIATGGASRRPDVAGFYQGDEIGGAKDPVTGQPMSHANAEGRYEGQVSNALAKGHRDAAAAISSNLTELPNGSVMQNLIEMHNPGSSMHQVFGNNDNLGAVGLALSGAGLMTPNAASNGILAIRSMIADARGEQPSQRLENMATQLVEDSAGVLTHNQAIAIASKRMIDEGVASGGDVLAGNIAASWLPDDQKGAAAAYSAKNDGSQRLDRDIHLAKAEQAESGDLSVNRNHGNFESNEITPFHAERNNFGNRGGGGGRD